jgi:hypothetical protein
MCLTCYTQHKSEIHLCSMCRKTLTDMIKWQMWTDSNSFVFSLFQKTVARMKLIRSTNLEVINLRDISQTLTFNFSSQASRSNSSLTRRTLVFVNNFPHTIWFEIMNHRILLFLDWLSFKSLMIIRPSGTVKAFETQYGEYTKIFDIRGFIPEILRSLVITKHLTRRGERSESDVNSDRRRDFISQIFYHSEISTSPVLTDLEENWKQIELINSSYQALHYQIWRFLWTDLKNHFEENQDVTHFFPLFHCQFNGQIRNSLYDLFSPREFWSRKECVNCWMWSWNRTEK